LRQVLEQLLVLGMERPVAVELQKASRDPLVGEGVKGLRDLLDCPERHVWFLQELGQSAVFRKDKRINDQAFEKEQRFGKRKTFWTTLGLKVSFQSQEDDRERTALDIPRWGWCLSI
jgi:hypothetical protein